MENAGRNLFTPLSKICFSRFDTRHFINNSHISDGSVTDTRSQIGPRTGLVSAQGNILLLGRKRLMTQGCLHPLVTYSCSTFLLEKLTGFLLVKKFPSFHGTRRFITAFTSVRHLSLSWAISIQSIPPHPTSWISILIYPPVTYANLFGPLFPVLFLFARSVFCALIPWLHKRVVFEHGQFNIFCQKQLHFRI